MWNEVNCTKNHFANIRTSSPYKQWSYLTVSCPRHSGWAPRGSGETALSAEGRAGVQGRPAEYMPSSVYKKRAKYNEVTMVL
jgi:hypothetical protein